MRISELNDGVGATRGEGVLGLRVEQFRLGAAMLLLFGVSLARPARADSAINALHWRMGPVSEAIGSQATLSIPKGYAFLRPAAAKKFLTLEKNPTGSISEYILAPSSLAWFAVMDFDNSGYVSDNAPLKPHAILKNLIDNTNSSNALRNSHGWPTLSVLGWLDKPRYRTHQHRLEWAVDLQDSNHQRLTNYNTKILGRDGVMNIVMVGDRGALIADEAELNSVLNAFHYNPGKTYSEHASGDKVAGYGLAALITGGAAAVAVKSGLFASLLAGLAALWKVLLVGVVGIGSYLRKMFRRK